MAWPKDNQAALIAFYGDPGLGAVDRKLVKVTPPFKMTYGGKPVPYLLFHSKAAPALERALNTVWNYYGKDQKKIDALGISKTAGTYNKRFIRGSSSKWSNHAYGAAIDINAEQNGFNMEGNIPPVMIAAFKAEGARWGGDYRGRTDPMHFEFCDSGEPERSFAEWLKHYGITSGGVAPMPTPKPAGRHMGIVATVFGGAGDTNASAYGGMVDPRKPGVALPARFAGVRPKVRVFNGGISIDCEIVDVGPWNTIDDYWAKGKRPQAETGTDLSGRRTNLAGIDLTPAAANAIGIPGKGKVDWEFVGVRVPTQPPFLTPTEKTIGIGGGIMAALAAVGSFFADNPAIYVPLFAVAVLGITAIVYFIIHKAQK